MSYKVRSGIVHIWQRRTGSALRKPFLWAVAGLAVFALGGFLVAPPILKSVLTHQLSEKLHREVSIREIRINPFVLSAQVNGFSIKDRGSTSPFISFEELYLNLQTVSLFKGGPVLREILLKAPHVTIVRNEDLTYNFSDLLEAFAAKPAPGPTPPSDAKPLRFSLNNIQIEGGSIEFEDRPKRGRHAVKDLNLAVPFVSNMPSEVDVYVQPAFQAKVNGTPIALAGKTKPFHDSLETALEVNISDFAIPKYLEYVPVELKFKVVSGSLDAKVSLTYTQYRDKAPVLVLAGRVALKTLAVTDVEDRPLLTLPLLDVTVESADVFSKKVNLASLLLQSPEAHLWRDTTGALNVMALAPAETGGDSPKSDQKGDQTGANPVSIEAAEVRLADGKVTFLDESMEKPFRATLEAVNVVVRHFSNAPSKPSAIEASLTTDAGETLKHTGEFTLQPLAAEGTVELNRLPVKQYAPYYGKTLLIEVEDGVLDLSTRYKFTQDETGGQTMLSGLAATLSSVRLKKKGEKEEFLKVPALSLKETDMDLGKRTLVVGEVVTRRGVIVVQREKDGTVNLATLVTPAPAAGKQKASPGAGPDKGKEAPWLVVLKKLAVERYAVKVEDRALSQPATLAADPVTLTADNLSTGSNSRGKASLRLTLNKTGTLSVNGAVGLNPVSANFKVDVKGIDLIPLQPYFTDKVKIVVTGGAVSANGNLTLAATKENEFTTAFAGQASVSNLSTVDKANAEDFVKWDSLSLSGIEAGTNPLQVSIRQIALTDFYSRLIVNPDGTLNVQGIVEGAAKPAETVEGKEISTSAAVAPTPPAPTPVKIDEVTLQGGNISFSDRFIKPNFSANLTQVGGRISGLSSEESQQAEVDLRGKLDNSAPLEITGKINPLSKDLFVDLKVDFKDIDLSPMTPYSGRYAGYTIQKGKLSLSLKYRIVRRKLDADNKVIIDQFTFGDPVDSPDATKLPVRLAVSLLKDRKGEISLDLPVTGSLDDPQFSVWGVVVKIITNLLAKAATSPFALIGALVGGGEELSHVEFAYGKSDLDVPMEAKLKTLAKALYERPALKLEVAGHVDVQKDLDGLRQSQFDRKLKAQKLNELVKKGAAAASLADITVEQNEYPTYLALAYKKETFPKPRNFLGMAKDLPAPEMEKLILTHIQVTDDDLRQLAMQRAQRVKDYLLKSGQVEPERVFLVDPQTLPQGKKDTLKDSRVDFVIK